MVNFKTTFYFSVVKVIMSQRCVINGETVNYTKDWAHFAIAYVQLVLAL